MDGTENVYLLQRVADIGKRPQYKIGRTLGFGKRRYAYGSDVKIISVKTVRIYDRVESLLKTAFKSRFILASGEETFEGDVQLMYKLFEEITSPYAYVDPFVYSEESIVIDNDDKTGEETDEYLDTGIPIAKSHLSITNLRTLSVEQLMILALETTQIDKSIQCPKCCTFKKDKESLTQHLTNQVKCCYQTILTRITMSNVCPKCGKSFADKWNAKTHLEKGRCKVLLSDKQ